MLEKEEILHLMLSTKCPGDSAEFWETSGQIIRKVETESVILWDSPSSKKNGKLLTFERIRESSATRTFVALTGWNNSKKGKQLPCLRFLRCYQWPGRRASILLIFPGGYLLWFLMIPPEIDCLSKIFPQLIKVLLLFLFPKSRCCFWAFTFANTDAKLWRKF